MFTLGWIQSDARRQAAFLRRVYAVALTYPAWHLAAPADAVDPWWPWWGVAAAFGLVSLASLRSESVERQLPTLFPLCSWLVTAHLYVLASINHMEPFYVVGSAMAVISTVIFIRSRFELLLYAALVALLSAILFLVEPDGRKAAYWGGMLTVMPLAYLRLSAQLTAARVVRHHQRDLEEQVAERTRALSEAYQRLQREIDEKAVLEEALRVSQKMEAVGRMAGGVAHDFNNLATTISVYTELLLGELPEDSPLRDEVAQIRRANAQTGGLTRQLLALTRRSTVETQVLDLNDVVDEALPMIRRLLAEDSQLESRLASARCCIRANRDQLDQVLLNLALNARDAMPQGGQVVVETRIVPREDLRSLELRSQLPHDTCVLLAFSDTGVGMEPEVRARAFDPFFTTKHGDEGTGLGLSMVYGIVAQGGGYVRVLSESGQGARFELYWPRVEGAPGGAASDPSAAELRRGSERILLVEDRDELRVALARVLRNEGYDVVEAREAESALKLASVREEHIDLLVTDVVMPRMSGFELAERIRSLRPDLRLLFLSGQLTHPSLRDRVLPADASLLQKPFTPQELSARVRATLDA